MNYILLDIWAKELKNNTFYRTVQENRFDKVLLFAMHEPYYWNMLNFYPIVEACDKQNKPLHIITSVEEYYNDIEPVELNATFERWPTFWLNKTFGHLDLSKEFVDTEYKHHYIMMVNRAHFWRCQLLDLLGKHKLISKGAISWHNIPKFRYDWKYTKPRIMCLSDNYHMDKQHSKVPLEYFNSFAQLVSETSADARWITEKTVTPLMLGKPFIVAGSPYFHKMLKDWGIELYDEIFDYSFDSIIDTEQRYDLLLKNFDELVNHSLNDLNLLYSKIKDKIEYNKTKIFEITADYDNFPKTAKEVIDHYLSTGISLCKVTISNYNDIEKAKKYKIC